jgi:hypothetical protein
LIKVKAKTGEVVPMPLGEWSGVIAPSFFTSALDGGEQSASRLGHFTSGETAPGTHWLGGWMGPRIGLDAVALRKIFCPYRELDTLRPARSSSLFPLSYPGDK